MGHTLRSRSHIHNIHPLSASLAWTVLARDEPLSRSRSHAGSRPLTFPPSIHSGSHSHIHFHFHTNPNPSPNIHRSTSTSTKVTSMPLDTWLSRVTCRRCGVPASRVPLKSYPFAYPPNCEATFQAINSKFSQNPPLPPLKLHHLMLPADNHNQAPARRI